MEIKNLTKNYVNKKGTVFPALKSFNAVIPEKGLIFLLGKSGCGKSTLLNIIGCIDTPTSGSIEISGTDITTLSKEERDNFRANNIGFIFQDFNLFEQLNVYENITFGITDINENIESKVDVLLEKLDIKECKRKNINELSGGEQQRVAIARALIKDCKILLADEPSGNLDENNGQMIFNILTEIAKERLVIIVSHDRSSAFKYAETVIEMHDGAVDKIIKQNEEIKKEDCLNLDFEKHKKKFSLKTTLKLSFNFMIKKKLKMVLSIILLAVSLGIMGVTFMLYQYDFGAMASNSIVGEKATYLSLMKGYTDPDTDKYNLTGLMRPIQGKEISELQNKYGLENVDLGYKVYGMTISKNASGSSYYTNKVENAIVSSENNIAKYNMELKYGVYPVGVNEIAITDLLANAIVALEPIYVASRLEVFDIDSLQNNDDFLIEALKKLDVETLVALFTEDWENVIKNPETLKFIRENYGLSLLNYNIALGYNTYKITGIINTGYKEKYGDIIYSANPDEMLAREFSLLSMNLYNSIFVDVTWIQTVYNGNKIDLGNHLIMKYSAYDKHDNYPPLNDDEMMMSRNMYRYVYGEEYNPDSLETRYYNNMLMLSNANGKIQDEIYKGKSLKVVGVFDSKDSYESIYSDNYFDEYIHNLKYCNRLNFKLPDNQNILSNLINEIMDYDMSYMSTNSFFIYQLANIMDIFKLVFLIISIVLGVFSAVLMYNYFSMIIQTQKKEIGIMRALGIPNKQIMSIYLLCSIMIIILTILVSWLIMSVMGILCDSILVKEFILFTELSVLSNLHIIIFGAVPFILTLAIGGIIAIVSTVFPILKIRKMSPINAIRNEG